MLSAEYMKYGKPHPQVFIDCAGKIGVSPHECLVIEDSLNGVIAGKAAQMRVVALPDVEHRNEKGFGVADYVVKDMTHVLELCKALIV